MRILLNLARRCAVTAVLAVLVPLGACSSPASSPAAANTASTPPPASASAVSSASSASAAGPSATRAVNLMLTPAIRAQLVAAAARLNSLPASAYLGLVHGESYYGFDPATNTYWAGGALDPSPSSERAQVSVQDDGGYYVFEEPAGGSWTATAVGMTGIGGAPCRVHLPPAIVTLWHWPNGTCRPAAN
jgi:hypothetical protein